MKSKRKFLLGMSALILSGTMVFSAVLPSLQSHGKTLSASSGAEKGEVVDVTGAVGSDLSQYFDTSVVEKLPEGVAGDREISVILGVESDTVLDGFNALGGDMTVGEYAATREGKAVSSAIAKKSNALLTKLTNAGVQYETGDRFDTLLGGVEVIIKASAFNTLCNAVKGQASVMVGEEYAACETQVVENKVNVYDTGIFDSSDSEYDGTGTVIAVLDTGLDSTHTAFDPARFTTDEASDVITPATLRTVVGELEAAKTTPGLTAANVYLNRKVPYAYDYADKDDDVSPIYNEHGTHVAGVMVGNDRDVNENGIRGVAPNAQLAVMKTFSDRSDGARTSWIVAALEDCVKLGVDVINMSLGSAAGFTREVDSDQRYAVYDRIKEQGISLVVAASNSYNSTFGSEKNGNLGLTSNPDSSTVGSPSTYDAALSVASISGVKTPYLKLGETIIYFTEASDSAAEPKDFVEEILAYGAEQGYVQAGVDSWDFEYEIIPGIGSAQNFMEYDDGTGKSNGRLDGKIALICRGQTNFEEKASLARKYGAVGCIIYNNVSGTISMNVGRLGNYPVCSLSRDDGELLLRAATKKIRISRSQEAGPFMSDFSSWGPTPDLRIKPEITAHGGDIYSAIPGQSYDRMSGTSMASPNQAGVTALVRQYVKDNFEFEGNDPETRRKITATVNQIMMSTADIALNTNGLPFSVRKQGAGLANLEKSTHSPAYLETFDRDSGEIMDKAKIELGDDPAKTGVYTMKFNIVNIGNSNVSYDVSATVMTEGVSEVLTYKGDTTVTEKGYLLDGAKIEVTGAENCTRSGNSVTVSGKTTATVTLTVTLTEENKEYIERSFKNGMYVEGFVTLKDRSNGSNKYDLNAPFLAFYGSWSAAPLFDLDYFATNADELDDSKETLEKTLPDAFATRPIGGLYDDYIAYLGAFPFLQDPNSTNKISADRDHIALTNQTGESGGINSINSVQLGLLRGAKRMVATVTDTTTGEIVFAKEERNLSKAYNYGGAIYGSSFDVDFSAADYDLKNNTKYLFRLTGYIDYKDGSVANNTFEFPFYTDFTAPIVTGVEYTYEYDRDTETNRLYANISVYDNHYVRGLFPGYLVESEPGADAPYGFYGFNRYIVPVNGGRNSTSVVQIDLTDSLNIIKEESYSKNSFLVQLVDCAQNVSMFELTIPDEIGKIDFEEEVINISPNEIYRLKPTISPSQDVAWAESIIYTSSNEKVARVVNGKLIGVSSGDAELTATSNHNPEITTKVKVHVWKPEDDEFEDFDRPIAENFRLTGYEVNRVYYFLSSDERDLGATEAGDIVLFSSDSSYSLKMLPSESVTIQYDLRGYFDESEYKVEFTSSNPNVVEVNKETGQITAKNVDSSGKPLNYERSANISVRLYMRDPVTGEYKSTTVTRPISVTVKAPYTTNGPYLVSYMGLGDKVEIPLDLGITEIQQFAFSNYNLVPKDLAAGDEITEEDPLYSKQWYIGNDIITEVVIPEGVKTIGMYAFAGLTNLRSVTFPSTLTKIQTGAFRDCTSLATVRFSGDNNLQFINQQAFENCGLLTSFPFRSIVAIGDAAFANAGLISVTLPATTQSIGAQAFAGDAGIESVSISARKVKIGAQAFYGCSKIQAMELNASVLPEQLFAGCTALSKLKIGADVEVIGDYALRGTKISRLEVASGNPYFTASPDGQYLLEKDTGVLALIAPATTKFSNAQITEIGEGAFSVAAGLTQVNMPAVTKVGDYAFSNCQQLSSVSLGQLESVGNYAFFRTAITTLPRLNPGITVGERAFSATNLLTVTLPENMHVGEYAFAQNYSLRTVSVGAQTVLGEGAFFANYDMTTVTIGDNVTIGNGAFSAISVATLTGGTILSGNTYVTNTQSIPTYFNPYLSSLTNITIGENVTIGGFAFQGAGSGSYDLPTVGGGTISIGGRLTTVTLGEGTVIGDEAFSGCHYLSNIDFSKVKSIGSYAFMGQQLEYVNYSDIGLVAVRATPFAAAFTEIDLSGLDPEAETPLGAGAFGQNLSLTTVKLPDWLDSVPAETFYGCTALTGFEAGELASVGVGAFTDTAIKAVSLAENAAVGAGAFSGCTQLATVNNLEKAASIGAQAFEQTALETADLSGVSLLGDFAFADSKLKSVKLGENLTLLGENPFAGCKIGDFKNEAGETTFGLGENAKVVDGVLFGRCPNGYVLVTYPIEKAGESYTVAKDVVRIGARAFLGAKLYSVELGRRVKAIGDKAFYECNELAAVAFTSVEAPILEEQYDAEFVFGRTGENGISNYLLYNVGSYNFRGTYYGAEIVPYHTWNADPTGVLFGANFVAAIGTPEGREVLKNKMLVMVRPINGTGYENFIYGQYFDVILNGPTAVSDDAQLVIDLIDALPETVSLEDEETVKHIRELYDALTPDQQGCVYNENLQKLLSAERRIDYLHSQEKGPDGGDTPQGNPYLWLYIVAGVVAVAAVAAVVAVLLLKKSKKGKTDGTETAEDVTSETEGETEETQESEETQGADAAESAEEENKEETEQTEPQEGTEQSSDDK